MTSRLSLLEQPSDGLGAHRPLLTLAELRAYLQLPSKFAVYRLIRDHALPYRRVGGRYRFAQHEIDAWTLQHRQSDRQRLAIVRHCEG